MGRHAGQRIIQNIRESERNVSDGDTVKDNTGGKNGGRVIRLPVNIGLVRQLY
jgi:hypothetical protein